MDFQTLFCRVCIDGQHTWRSSPSQSLIPKLQATVSLLENHMHTSLPMAMRHSPGFYSTSVQEEVVPPRRLHHGFFKQQPHQELRHPQHRARITPTTAPGLPNNNVPQPKRRLWLQLLCLRQQLHPLYDERLHHRPRPHLNTPEKLRLPPPNSRASRPRPFALRLRRLNSLRLPNHLASNREQSRLQEAPKD